MKIDLILPCFSGEFAHGSYVHFSLLAEALQARGHDVLVRAGYAATMSVEGGIVAWRDRRPEGPARVGNLSVVYYRHRRRFHPRCMAMWIRFRATVLADAWKLRDVPRPIDTWRLQSLDADATGRLAKTLYDRAEAAGYGAALYSTYALGPHLPMRRMVRDAKRRGATVIAGYFPFSTCPDAVKECRRAGVPVWVAPLFHALDVPHQNKALHDAARHANGVLALSPFNQTFFRDVVGCRNVACVGSAPPPVAVSDTPPPKDGAAPYCVVFGRFHAGKNVGEAVRIVDALRRTTVPNMRLTVISSGAELKDYLPPYASVKSGITSEEARGVLVHATALLFPSLHESFGIVCVEALRCGTPAIVKRSNHATASVLRAHGLERYLYDMEGQAVDLVTQVHEGTLRLPPDQGWFDFTWEAVGQRVEAALLAGAI